MQNPWKKDKKLKGHRLSSVWCVGSAETSGKEMRYWKQPSKPWGMMAASGGILASSSWLCPTLSLHWGKNAGLNAAENCTLFLAPDKQVKQLLCNLCQMSFIPSARTFSISIFSDKSCDGAAGGATPGQVLVVSCRVPAESPDRAWEGQLRALSLSFLQGSAWLIVLRWETQLYLQKSVSKWVICVYFSFFLAEKAYPKHEKASPPAL